MKVRSLRKKLEALVAGESPALSDSDLLAIKALLATLKLNDSKSVEEVCAAMGLDITAWFRPRANRQPVIETPTDKPIGSLSSQLRERYYDDKAFAALISQVKADRRTTKAMVATAYKELFGDVLSYSSKTKTELLQDIADERLARVRHEKAARALARTQAE